MIFTQVTYVGDNRIVNRPIVNGDNILIPIGWYLINGIIDINSIVYLNDIIIQISKLSHIYHTSGHITYKLTSIKTETKLNINDILKIY
jgi:hypothetical protein